MNKLTILSLLLLAGFLFMTFGCIETGRGTSTDTIARTSYEGLIWKTWRVELTNDHPISDGYGGTISQRYGVDNNAELQKTLQDYQANTTKVKLYYRSELFVWPWEYSDSEIIYDVKRVI